MKRIKNAFTLVELVVVITILAILATLAFVSYSSYSMGARDTNRISSLSMIGKAMEVFSIDKDLPLPENYVEIRNGSTVIAYQGEVSKKTLTRVGYYEEGLDPRDEIPYTYYLSKNLKDFQLMGFLEEPAESELSSNLLINKSSAVDYSSRYTFLFGKQLGIFTDVDNIALQNIESIKSMTPTPYIDISNLSATYKAHIGTDSFIEGTGTDLQILKDNLDLGGATSSCSNLLSKKANLKNKDGYYLIAPEGGNAIEVYCDMTTDGGGWTRYLNIKGNYTFQDAKDCWLGTKINNSLLECFNPNRHNMDISDKMMGIIGGNTYYYTPPNPEASTTTENGSSRLCLGGNDYMTLMKSGSYPNPDASDASYVRLGMSYCGHNRSIGGRSSSNYMNYEHNDGFGPTPGSRASTAEFTEIYIR